MPSRRLTVVAAAAGGLAAIGGVVLATLGGGVDDDAVPAAIEHRASVPRARASRPPLVLRPAAETRPSRHGGEAIEDVALWIHPRRPSRSIVIATDRFGGIGVSDLSGREIQYRPDGPTVGIDVRPGVRLHTRRVALVAASNTVRNTIRLYRVDERTRRLLPMASIAAGIEVHGLCLYRSPRTGATHVFVTGKNGVVEQWRLSEAGGRMSGRRVRRLVVGGAVETCVVDDGLGALYVSEEERAVWKYGAEPDDGDRRTLVDSTGSEGPLKGDIKGLAIARGPKPGAGVLIVASQGSPFALYRREGHNPFVRAATIDGGPGIDAVEEPDAIEVTPGAHGHRRAAWLAVQDHQNGRQHENVKLVFSTHLLMP